MEIILEILIAVLGFLLEALFEVLAQVGFEMLAEIGLRSLVEPFRKPSPMHPFLAGIGYFVYGAIAGGLSLLLPKIFTVPFWLRISNLIITPVVCGVVMAKVGQMREQHGEKTMRIDTFFYGYLFALSMAVVRFIWR
jgi:hypothetical protein